MPTLLTNMPPKLCATQMIGCDSASSLFLSSTKLEIRLCACSCSLSLDADLSPKATTSALYPYTSIRTFAFLEASSDFSEMGKSSVGQNTPLFAVQVFCGWPFSPWTRTMSALASGWA